jgi:hypothetical protein
MVTTYTAALRLGTRFLFTDCISGSVWFPQQAQTISVAILRACLCNSDVMCLLRGDSWTFIYNVDKLHILKR